VPAQIGVLERVLGVGDASEHPVGDAEQQRAMGDDGIGLGHGLAPPGADVVVCRGFAPDLDPPPFGIKTTNRPPA
jgi:hypothetical protein